MKKQYLTHGPYLVFFAALLWASDAPFRVHLTQSLPSDLIVLLEHVVVLIILIPFVPSIITDIKKLHWQQYIALLFIGVGGSALALVLFTESFNYMNPSVVILLQKLQPLIAIALAIGILKEHTPVAFWKWSILALGSAYLISFPDLVPQLYEGEVFNPHIVGALLAVSAAFLWGTATVLGKYVLDTVSFKTVTVLRFLIAFLFLFGYNYTTGSLSVIASVTYTDWLYIGIISITSGVVAMYIYYRGLSTAKASVATIAELGFPMGAVVINYVFLDALLAPVQILGMVVLIIAVFQLGKINQAENVYRNN